MVAPSVKGIELKSFQNTNKNNAEVNIDAVEKNKETVVPLKAFASNVQDAAFDKNNTMLNLNESLLVINNDIHAAQNRFLTYKESGHLLNVDIPEEEDDIIMKELKTKKEIAFRRAEKRALYVEVTKYTDELNTYEDFEKFKYNEFTLEHFQEYGLGIALYFGTLKDLFHIMLFMSIMSLPPSMILAASWEWN